MRDTAANATRDASPLKNSIAQLAADFKALGLSMSAVTPTPAK
jgi:phage-related minor tail protein